MQCTKCGKELSLDDKVCPICGNVLIEDTPGLDHTKEEIIEDEVNDSIIESVEETAAKVEQEEAKNAFSVPISSYEEEEAEAPRPVFEDEEKEEVKEEAVVESEEETKKEVIEEVEEVKEEPKLAPSPLAPPPTEEAVEEAKEEEAKDFTFLSSHHDEINNSTATVQKIEDTHEEIVYEASTETVPSEEYKLASEVNPETVSVDYSEVNTNQGYDEGYTRKTPIGLIIAVVVVACLVFGGVGVLVGSQVFGTKETPPTTQKDDDDSGNTTVEPVKTTSVIFAGNKFEIPVEYDYEVKEGKLSIYDESVYYYVQVAPSSYAQYAANIPYIKDNYTKLGYTVESAAERTVLKSKYVILDLVKSTGEKVTLFLRAFTTNQSFVCAVGRSDGKFATNSELNKIENILATKTLIASKSYEGEEEVRDDNLLSVIVNGKLPD